MKLNVNANRMELMKLKKRIVLARRGHKLLKDKLDEMIRQFFALIENYKTLREQVENKLAIAYKSFAIARAEMPREVLEESMLTKKDKVTILTSSYTVMNVKVPKLEMSGKAEIDVYSFAETNSELDNSLLLFAEVLPLMIKLAELEKSIELLSEEIEKTRRRVNALEYVLIPNLQETIKYIAMKLGEVERSALTRLMKVKEIVRAH